MKTISKKSVLGALAGVALIATAGVASAGKPPAVAYDCTPPEYSVAALECGEQYGALYTAIQWATFVNDRDENAVVGKCDESIVKLSLLKTADAAQKLRDIVAKVSAPTFKGSAGNVATAAEATAQCAESITIQ